jgi:hypothetical protein
MSPGLPSVITPSSAILARNDNSTVRSRSPLRKIECADFEDVRLTHPASAILHNSGRNSTSYSPESLTLDEDNHQASGAINTYRQSITHAFLDKCKLPPLITRATNASTAGLSTPPPCEPLSPTKTRPNLVTSNSNISNLTTSTASRASTHARAVSQNLFDSFFNGASSQLNIGILPTSPSRSIPEDEQQYPDGYEMEGPFTRAQPRSTLTTRTRRSSSAQSPSSTVGGRLGGWFSGVRAPAAKPNSNAGAGITPEDPLLTLSISNTLFPHGQADPLDPTSFHDLVIAAESLCSKFQSAYKMRCAEVRDLRAEAAVQMDEVCEGETRARHLKMQLEGMAAQLTAQEGKANMLERMLEEERSRRRQSEESQEMRRTSIRLVKDEDDCVNWKRSHAGSDSGFESDGDSVFSANSPTIRCQSPTGELESKKVRTARVPQDDVRQRAPIVSSCQNCTGPLRPSAFGSADLRNENQRLKHRILELEIAVDGCMEMVSSPWR